MPKRGNFFYFIVKSMDVFQRIYMRLYTILSPSSETDTVFDARMLCNSRDFVQRRIRFFGIFEHNLTHFTLSKLKRGDGYADVGANVGYYSLLASKKVGDNGVVVSVEADPTTFTRLQTNLSLNNAGNVRALNVAATAEPCTISIKKGIKHNAGANAVAVDAAGTIQGLPLKTILGDDIEKINFIKIDIEGSEGPVLRSILDNLHRFPALLIIASEVSDRSSAFVEQFIKAGFKAYVISNIYTIDYYLIRSYLTGSAIRPLSISSKPIAFSRGKTITFSNGCRLKRSRTSAYNSPLGGWSMRGRFSKELKATGFSAAVSLLSFAPASADCRSVLNSPEWPGIARTIASAQLCEQLPLGPNHTARFEVLSVDICSLSSSASSVVAKALLTCESSSDALFQTPPLDGEVVATVTLDIGACRITDANIQISGEIGALLSGLQETQQFARDWAQSQLSSLCRLR